MERSVLATANLPLDPVLRNFCVLLVGFGGNSIPFYSLFKMPFTSSISSFISAHNRRFQGAAVLLVWSVCKLPSAGLFVILLLSACILLLLCLCFYLFCFFVFICLWRRWPGLVCAKMVCPSCPCCQSTVVPNALVLLPIQTTPTFFIRKVFPDCEIDPLAPNNFWLRLFLPKIHSLSGWTICIDKYYSKTKGIKFSLLDWDFGINQPCATPIVRPGNKFQTQSTCD